MSVETKDGTVSFGFLWAPRPEILKAELKRRERAGVRAPAAIRHGRSLDRPIRWFLCTGRSRGDPARAVQGRVRGHRRAVAADARASIIDPVQAAAILLPILIVQDVVGVWAFRRSVDWLRARLDAAGRELGYRARLCVRGRVSAERGAGAGRSDLDRVRRLSSVGRARRRACRASAVARLGGHAVRRRFGLYQPDRACRPTAVPALGAARRLPRDVLVGTTAIFFAAVNWIKVPAYFALGQFSRANLLTTASAAAGGDRLDLAGVWLVRRVSAGAFLHRDLCADDSGRRETGLGRGGVVPSRQSNRLRDRAFVGDAADRLAEQRRDRQVADAFRSPVTASVAPIESVMTSSVERRALDARDRAARQHAVGDIGDDALGARLLQRRGGVAQRARRIDDVVDQDAEAALRRRR